MLGARIVLAIFALATSCADTSAPAQNPPPKADPDTLSTEENPEGRDTLHIQMVRIEADLGEIRRLLTEGGHAEIVATPAAE
jgi:hypothetical protein